LIILVVLLALIFSIGNVMADANVGVLRVDRLVYPRQVAPSSNFQVTVDVEYGLYGANPTATIRSAIYNGPINYTTPLWQSDMVNVSYVGEQLWNATLTSPGSEGYLNLTAYAFYLEGGVWKYYNNSPGGPGFSQATIKVGKISNLEVYVGVPGVGISINGTTITTAATGDANVDVPLNSVATVSVPPIIEFQNSTRSVFRNWNDANTQTQRDVTIDGDTRLIANYTLQYLLRINSPSSSEAWYDNGSNVTLNANASLPMNWPLNLFGVHGEFTGWSGDVQSSSMQVNLIMDGPKTVNANYSIDYRMLAVPVIVALGVIVLLSSIILILLRRRRTEDTVTQDAVTETATETGGEAQTPICPNCGKPVEKEWAHCIKCGAKLANDSSNESEADS
jgi:hypothetical protein